MTGSMVGCGSINDPDGDPVSQQWTVVAGPAVAISDNPATNLTGTYRWSTDLSGFHDNGDTDPEGTKVDFSVGTPSNGEVTVTATVSGTETDRLFVAVAVMLE